MKTRWLWIGLVIAAAVWTAGPATAESAAPAPAASPPQGTLLPPRAPAPQPAGKVAQFAEQVSTLLMQFDADKDRTLSATELRTFEDTLATAFGQEWVARVRVLLKLADADSNGAITETELSNLLRTATDQIVNTAANVKTEMVPMSDGVRLATDVYLPPGQGPFPVILSRTPYGKGQFRGFVGMLTLLGYACVGQDMRGRFDSEGENLPFVGCGWAGPQDGAETVAWILKQPWCNGKVGTVGGSALGITQNLMAGAAPPGLVAQYIQVAAASLYHHAAYVGGALRLCQIENWTAQNRFDPQTLQIMREHPAYDDYWRRFDSLNRVEVMNCPAVHVGGWFDTFAQGTIDAFVARQERGAPGARGRQKLVMGPWDHGGWRRGKVGDLVFPRSDMPKQYDAVRWFEHHLLGVDNGVMKEPAVAYYVMGDTSDPQSPGNEWRYADAWPIPSTATPYYFLKGGGLSPSRPAAGTDEFAEYTFDPGNPCPTIGGANLTIAKGPKNQNPIESRSDVLLFTTEPLAAPLEVTGRVLARIFVSSSAPDTDLSVRLCDVYPDGRSFLMTDGILRLRFRSSFERPEPLKPGEAYEVTVDCWSTSIVFAKGHRIRVAVTSSNHPRFDVNPGTGRPWTPGCQTVKQTNRIYCGGARPSAIVLPVVSSQAARP